MLADLVAYADALKVRVPSVMVKLFLFDLGGASMSVWSDEYGYEYEFVYQPSMGGIGIAKITEDSSFLRGYDVFFADFEAARHYFEQLLQTAENQDERCPKHDDQTSAPR